MANKETGVGFASGELLPRLSRSSRRVDRSPAKKIKFPCDVAEDVAKRSGCEPVGSTVMVTPLLEGNAAATNILTGLATMLNLQDPDSTTLTPGKDILLDSQGYSELVLVRKPGSKQQSAVLIPLSSPYGQARL